MIAPDPPVPPECDCRGLPFMPLDVVRLRDSDLAALATGDEFKAAVLLWCAAWGQLPAGSLPDDERILARLAGVSLAEWRGLSDMAMRGWELCSDGRFYHPVIAEKAAEAWAARSRQRARAEARWSKRPEDDGNAPAKPPQSRGTAKSMPRHAENRAAAMQGTGTVKGTESPLAPQGVSKADVDAVWSLAPKRSRERSSRGDVERTLAAAVKRGHQPAEVLAGLKAYFASDQATKDGGEYVKGVHRMIEADRWQSYVEELPLLERAGADVVPFGPRDDWASRFNAYRRNEYWNRLDWGPPPGHPDCAVPADVLRANGYDPAPVAPAAGGHAA
jgi:uncharacterized protein YdaU (DUF1376 family)